ncbi:RNA polymerase-binding protein RbpA [Plantibacter sp. VKM Ac-2885]|jgi:ribosomal protein L37AE/L43A|uniref:RNA polymerase-binding protein RbpA n=2 Tax=Plantibacter TaxID=190323 RepID=A0A1S7B9L2_9MICO|nr:MULTISPECIES: RNA polymerase-binding protein RbpA [Plantibacter]AQX80386.1 electron transporter [Plantibacter flavus]AZH83941.1 RNA polymerase-binding protein RbpA [Plantibacter sp. PA-3-X8]MBD8103084.1 RNA polymerase-binding protein RbpA [Plantibacter sp. CFBP 8775]MBD8466197.1 RNA polymerase-binding protein RbpA [Plantibacter sp. CFBP 8798]MBD8515446.1 RNA polymerase-binding protein RbpA [Plantibacter sp. CFBP 8804]
MADRSLRGMRLGAQSLQTEEGVIFSARSNHIYRCQSCERETTMTFAADAEVPELWECRHCGAEAVLLVDSKPVVVDRGDVKTPRSHWDMLLERRSRDELEELLEERLSYLRARRGQQKSA